MSQLQLELIEAEIAEAPPHVRAHYAKMVAAGQTPQFALACATRSAPTMGERCDRVFNEQARYRMRTMDAYNQKRVLEIAHQAGVNTNGKYYVGGLGRYDNPRAWCSTVDDVRDALKDRPFAACEGAYTQKSAGDPPPPKYIPLAEDIKAEFRQKYLAADPGLAEKVKKNPKKLKELDERIVATHGGKRKG